MNITILGAGALGSFIGGMLSTKWPITLVGRKAHIDAIKKNDLKITGKTNLTLKLDAVEDIQDVKSSDMIILTVKSYDTKKAVKEALSAVGKDAIILSLQNGLNNVEKIIDIAGSRGLICGVTSHGITFANNGHIHHAGVGETIIGAVQGVNDKELQKICDMFNAVGIETKKTDNIRGEIWAKVIVNAGINPLTALTHLQNGALLEIPELKALLEGVCREAIEVANACNVQLPCSDLIEKTKEVARSTKKNKSSMLQDIERRRKTEIESINGEIVRLGKKHNIGTPINRVLVALVKSIETDI